MVKSTSDMDFPSVAKDSTRPRVPDWLRLDGLAQAAAGTAIGQELLDLLGSIDKGMDLGHVVGAGHGAGDDAHHS